MRIGSMRCRVDMRDKRCVMVTIDPAGADPSPAVLRAIAKELDACFGVYGTIVEPGVITVGETVVLES